MGLIFLCDLPKLSIFECIINDIMSIFSLILSILLIIQIFIRIRTYRIPFHNSTFLFYLMFFQTSIYNIYNIAEPYLELYLVEIYLRHIIFVCVTYFFSKKALKFGSNTSIWHLRFTKIFTVLLLSYFTGVLFYSLFKHRTGPICKDVFWIYLRVSGIILCFICCFVAYGLGKLLEETLGEYRHRHELDSADNKSLEGMDNEYRAMSSLIYLNLRKNVDNLWRIVLFLTVSQFLSLCNYLYYIFNEDPTCDLLIPDSKHPKCQKIDILNVFVMSITKIICYFAPLIVTTSSFWKPMKRVTMKLEDTLEDEEPEGYYGNLKYNYVGLKTGMN